MYVTVVTHENINAYDLAYESDIAQHIRLRI